MLRKSATAAELETAQSALVLVQPIQALLVVDQTVLIVEPSIADHTLHCLVLIAFDFCFLLVDLMGL